MSFEGFDPAAVALLADLPGYDQTQFTQVREQLATGLREPGIALITDVAALTDADLSCSPRSSVSPLHRDLRFAKAGTPKYKDHLLLSAWQGSDKKSSPGLWIRIAAEGIGFASGINFDKTVRERWQAAVGADGGAALASHLQELQARYPESKLDIAGKPLAKVPKPWPADHSRADLLRLTGFQVRFERPSPTCMTGAEFAHWCAQVFEALLPTHRWLIKHLSA